MSTDTDTGAAPAPTLSPRRVTLGLDAAAGIGATLAAALPPLVLAGKTVARHPDVPLAGDQAVIQLAAVNAGHHAQRLGPYSRFGWHHPGPSWFYLLDGGFLPLGSHSWSLIAAVGFLHAAVAAGIALLVWRRRGGLAALVATALLLAWFHSVGADKFLTPWNPYAILLPTVLLVLLAGATAQGSAASFCAMLVVASFLVQTHVSTAPAVALITLAAGVLLVVGHRRGWRVTAESAVYAPDQRSGWRDRLVLFAALGSLLLLVLMWLPPIIEQFAHTHGNLSQLIDWFRAGHGEHGLGTGFSAVGHELLTFPFGHYDDTLAADAGTLSAAAVIALAGFVAGCAGLVWLGPRFGDHFAQGVALASFLGAAAAIWSVTAITGPVEAYLLAWVTALPVALAIGYASLLGTPAARGLLARYRAAPAAAAGAAATIATAALLAGQVGSFADLDARTQAPADDGPIQAAAAAAVAALPPGPLLVDAAHDSTSWPVATGITLRLVQDGRRVEVPDAWVSLWGDQFARSRARLIGEILVVPSDSPAAAAQIAKGGRQIASGLGEVVLLVSPPP